MDVTGVVVSVVVVVVLLVLVLVGPRRIQRRRDMTAAAVEQAGEEWGRLVGIAGTRHPARTAKVKVMARGHPDNVLFVFDEDHLVVITFYLLPPSVRTWARPATPCRTVSSQRNWVRIGTKTYMGRSGFVSSLRMAGWVG